MQTVFSSLKSRSRCPFSLLRTEWITCRCETRGTDCKVVLSAYLTNHPIKLCAVGVPRFKAASSYSERSLIAMSSYSCVCAFIFDIISLNTENINCILSLLVYP